MQDVSHLIGDVTEGRAKKGGVENYRIEAVEGKPAEAQPHPTLVALELLLLVQLRVRRKGDGEEKREFVNEVPFVLEEVLHYPNQPLNMNLDAKFLAHLAPQRLRGRLQPFDAPTRQSPEWLVVRAL
jgi:hypothetical protein